MKNNKEKELPNEFRFKKKFGQNFLTDTNLLRAIAVVDAGVREGDMVLEIGAGAGALTTELSKASGRGGKVISVEIDKTLNDFLAQKFSGTNVEFMFGDILKIPPQQIAAKFANKPFKVVANLPYYISTPIIFYLIESGLKIESITVMLQKELVDRITAKPGGKDYGAITVILGLYGQVKKCRDVPRKMFTPAPNVDSAILSIVFQDSDLQICEISRVVKTSFAMRRKTLANNLMEGFSLTRDEVNVILNKSGLPLDIRAEKLDEKQFVTLTQNLSNILK